jgi:hypothetical protein
MAYSQDLRERVIDAVEQTGSRAQPSLAATSRDVGAALGVSRTPVMSRFLRHLGVTLKKNACRARCDVSRHRRRWIQRQGQVDPTRRVFIDETLGSSPRAGSGPRRA